MADRSSLVLALFSCAAIAAAVSARPDERPQASPTPTPQPSASPSESSPGAPEPLTRTKNAREIRSLVRSLGDPKWEVREAARDRLFQLGEECVPHLERAARDSDAERAAAADELLGALRWKVPAELRQLIGESLDDFPALPEAERLQALGAFTQRPQESRAVGVRFLLNVARFDPAPRVRQGAATVYLEITEPSLPALDGRMLEALADEQETDGRVSLLRARLLLRLDRLDEAIKAAESSVGRSPRARAPIVLLIELLVRAERFAEALPMVQSLESLVPQDLEIRILSGEILVRAGQEEPGLAKLAAVAADPEVIQALPLLIRLGRAYVHCQRPEEALKVYARAREKFPLQYELNVASAEVLEAQGKTSDALLIYLSEIRYAGQGSGRYQELSERIAKILREGGAGWLAEEESFFRDAQRGRKVEEARRVVATWLLRRGLAEEAEAEARAVVVLARGEARSWILLGDALRDGGKLEAAREAYEQAGALAPEAPLVKARLQNLQTRSGGPQAEGEDARGFAFWDQRIPVRGTEAVSDLVPPPVILSDHVAVPAAGLIDVYGLERADGRLAWRFAPEPVEPEEGASADQYGMELVSLVPVAPAVVAAVNPARAMDRRPLLCALYNLYWRPAHRSWRKARFRGLIGYVIDPSRGPTQGKSLRTLKLADLTQVVRPFPVARGGRVLACGSQGTKRLEVELVDLIRQETLWRASVPSSVQRPLFGATQILLGFEGGVLAINHAGETLWKHQRPEEGAIASTNLAVGAGRCFYGTADGELVGLSLEDGKVSEIQALGTRLTGVAVGAERVFAAERGGAVRGIPLSGSAAVGSWTQPGTKAASRRLAFAGGKVFALNGSDDAFRDEIPLLLALDPATGQILLKRPVSRPATLVHDERLVVIASGGADASGGLRVIGASPLESVDPASQRLAELRSAAADALAEGQFEVAAIVSRKFERRVGSRDLLSDEAVRFLVKVLAKSKRPEEALDLIHYAEERAELAGAVNPEWQALALELGLEAPVAPEEPAPPAPGGANPVPPGGEEPAPPGEEEPAPPGEEEPGEEESAPPGDE